MNREKTLILIKPDAVQRGLMGKLLSRLEDKGFTICAMKLLQLSRRQAEELYQPHKGKLFYEPTVQFMSSSPLLALVVEGYNAVNTVRKMNGATNPLEAEPGSIRGDFAMKTDRNCVHASDSPESFEREVRIFFSPEEILPYRRVTDIWM